MHACIISNNIYINSNYVIAYPVLLDCECNCFLIFMIKFNDSRSVFERLMVLINNSLCVISRQRIHISV